MSEPTRSVASAVGRAAALLAGLLVLLAPLAGEARPRRVLVLDDPDYVDTFGGAASESDTVQQSLSWLGHFVTTADLPTLPTRLDSAEVLLIPELEVGDLDLGISAGTRAVIEGFVAGGGTLVTHGEYLGRNSAFVNTTFGTSISAVSAVQTVFTPTVEAEGTRFHGGPAALPNPSLTMSFSGGGIDRTYYSWSTENVAVEIWYGAGRIVLLGWDWYDASPLGTVDGGWLDVLDRAVQGKREPRRVAVFDDPAYVDSAGVWTAESDTVQASLALLGHTVKPFAGVTQLDWVTAMDGAEVLIVPELEVQALSLDPATRTQVAGFVSEGLVLIAHAEGNQRNVGFINEIFGFSLTNAPTSGSAMKASDPGPGFDGGPSAISNRSATRHFNGLPAGAVPIYEDAANAWVVSIPHGKGKIILLGWDWFNAAPLGTDGQEWLPVLDRAVREGRPRARAVALLDDPVLVDTSGGAGAESDNLQAGLASLGHHGMPFTSFSDAGVAQAIALADVLHVPELENGTLVPGSTASLRVRNFVRNGGVVIVHGNHQPNENVHTFLSAVFGFATSQGALDFGGGPAADLIGDAAGTPFAGGPTSLPQNNGTAAILGLPPEARIIYRTPGGDVLVATVPLGQGHVVYLGWDWYDAAPAGAEDGGWLDVLDRAMLLARPAARRVAVFDDATYVDSGPTAGDESTNVQSSLAELGHVVEPFTGIDEGAFLASLARADVLLVPELEAGNLAAAPGFAGEEAIREFVASGGVLVIHGQYQSRASALLNWLFQFGLTETLTSTLSGFDFVNTEPRFQGGPLLLEDNNALMLVQNLPSGAQVLYDDLGADATVISIPYGAGKVFYLGWDWYNAAPKWGVDGGWLTVLDRAVRTGRTRERRVVVFDDPAYVDTDFGNDSEADNAQSSVEWLGHDVGTFTGTTASDFAAALGDADVLLLPELELIPLALDAPTRQVVARFVTDGGVLVSMSDFNALGFGPINDLFGTSIGGALVGLSSADLTAEASGTAYAGGPPTLPYESAVTYADGLPQSARSIYESGLQNSWVTEIPVGAGRVVLLGWDWFSAAPLGGAYGPQDGGWLEVLDRSIGQATHRSRRVSVFDDPAYVDTGGLYHDESDAVQAALASYGHRVRTFTGTLEEQFADGLNGAQVLLVPELENGDLLAALDAATRDRIVAFVQSGGVFITHGGNLNANNTALYNTLFGGTGTQIQVDNPSAIDANAGDTRFAGGPASLPAPLYTRAIRNPGAGVAMYESAANDATVVMRDVGQGKAIWLGYDFNDAPPLGTADAEEWLEVLDRAVRHAGRSAGVDQDGDGVADPDDNCSSLANPIQDDNEPDGLGDACDPDDDNDGLTDAEEGGLGTNPFLSDTDGDGLSDYDEVNVFFSDPLDEDMDGDLWLDGEDNCPFVSNPDQANTDPFPAGNDCQCGDPGMDGSIDVLDVANARRDLVGSPVSPPYDPSLCSVSGPILEDGCDVADIFWLRRALSGLSTQIGNVCPAYFGQ